MSTIKKQVEVVFLSASLKHVQSATECKALPDFQ